MARIHVFADEAGNFDFSRNKDASTYFILTTVTFFDDRSACHDLDRLRYELAWEGAEGAAGPFHATEEKQAIRDRVFAALSSHGFRVDATIFEKSKSQPQLRASPERFYQYAWYYHMRHVAPQVVRAPDELLVIAASIGTKKKEAAFHRGVVDVMTQVTPILLTKTAHWPASSDTGLQIADYCCWAIQKKWERNDPRSHALIADKIRTEFPIFRYGSRHYY